MNFLFVYNKKAGKKFKASIVETISARIPASIEHQFIDIRALKHSINLENYDAFVAIGGDGTVNTVAALAYKLNKTLAIIPKGSGDGLARFLHIPRNIKKALDVVLREEIISIDIGLDYNHFFVNVAGAGFEAEVAHKFGASGIRGIWGYIKTIIGIFKNHNEKLISLEVDGESIETTFFSLSIANGAQWGNNFKIASKADIQDGFFDIAIMKKPKFYQIPILLAYLRNNKQGNNSLFTYFKAAKIDIQKSGKIWHLDGEPLVLKNKKSIRIEHQSLKTIIAE